jgi:IS4 transposase
MLSLQGNWPAWAAITDANFPDMKMLDHIPVAPGAYYVMDRGYLDFPRLFRLHQAGGFFVVRNKHHVQFRVRSSRPVDRSTGLRCDQTIQLITRWSLRSYPHALRRIRFYDAENQVALIWLTNQFDLTALTIAELYRKRWQVELFFKWIKQHLRIRTFYGRSENAVRCQIWSAICAYLMVAILKKRLEIRKSLNEILQIVSVNIFAQEPLQELLATDCGTSQQKVDEAHTQKLLIFQG